VWSEECGVKELQSKISIRVRFSEIDAMRVVWHGAYAKYFEDAREQFGRDYGLSYELIERSGYFAPLVDLSFQYKQPIRYDMAPVITITYRPAESAKIVFDYEILNPEDGTVMATGHSVQVFMTPDYQLVWYTPDFYKEWKKQWNL
jgi:acyl-CoA thioester hydrolase